MSNESVESLLIDWRRRAREGQLQHYNAGLFFSNMHLWFGVPVIVLTAIAGLKVVPSLGKAGPYHDMLLGVIAVLTALQTFFGFAKRGEQHRTAGASYGALRRFIEQIAAFAPYLAKDTRPIDEARVAIDALAKQTPQVPGIVYTVTMMHLNARQPAPLRFGTEPLPLHFSGSVLHSSESLAPSSRSANRTKVRGHETSEPPAEPQSSPDTEHPTTADS